MPRLKSDIYKSEIEIYFDKIVSNESKFEHFEDIWIATKFKYGNDIKYIFDELSISNIARIINKSSKFKELKNLDFFRDLENYKNQLKVRINSKTKDIDLAQIFNGLSKLDNSYDFKTIFDKYSRHLDKTNITLYKPQNIMLILSAYKKIDPKNFKLFDKFYNAIISKDFNKFSSLSLVGILKIYASMESLEKYQELFDKCLDYLSETSFRESEDKYIEQIMVVFKNLFINNVCNNHKLLNLMFSNFDLTYKVEKFLDFNSQGFEWRKRVSSIQEISFNDVSTQNFKELANGK